MFFFWSDAGQTPSKPAPTKYEIASFVENHTGGISAWDLILELSREGYSTPDAQQALQAAIDTGLVKTGPGLKLYVSTRSAMVA